MSPEDLTLVQVASEIRNQRLSPVDYLHSLLRQIDRVEPDVHAWVTLDRENALREAIACETEARSGRFRGPLHGVPIGLKDIFCSKGLRTTAGARFLQNFVPDHDAEAVTRLRQAGAIILGKTVTTEFATFDPGPTRNPRNLAHTPGGSSSGSAAAVAAGMCPAATGSQTVASIGRPAAYCGVVGFMPTQVRVSRAGVFPVAWSLDHVGGFGRCVGDAHMLLEALSGHAVPLSRPKNPIRVGVVRGLFVEKATPETRDLHERTLTRLDAKTFALEEAIVPPIFEIQASILMMIMRSEVSAAHSEFYRDNSMFYSQKLRALVETGMLVDAQAYLRAQRLRKRYQQEMARLFERFDILMTPGATGTAPEGLGATGDPAFTGPWALADFPTLTIPSGKASNGLPIAIQITAAPLQEGALFSIGQEIEHQILSS
jgi:aspartyl-tRNA(Asn)/glutamyl-tRNA(Gln) amidotransferase subunit A